MSLHPEHNAMELSNFCMHYIISGLLHFSAFFTAIHYVIDFSLTGASEMRVKEAGNINNSLHILGRCIEGMKNHQIKRCVGINQTLGGGAVLCGCDSDGTVLPHRRGDEHVVPFRESKLTQLFQNYFFWEREGSAAGDAG